MMERIDILKSNESRFWLGVKKGNSDECWIWMRYKDEGGYGKFQLRHEGKKRNYAAHRVSYELIKGKIPDGLLVCHTCDNPSCVNPNHFFLGTHQDNCDDKVKKNRQAKGENNGASKLTLEIVNEIRQEYKNKIMVPELAIKYNIDETSVRNILVNKNWKDENYIPVELPARFVVGHKHTMVLSEEKVLEIKKLIKEGKMPKEISEKTGVKAQTIKDIKRGIAYFNVKL